MDVTALHNELAAAAALYAHVVLAGSPRGILPSDGSYCVLYDNTPRRERGEWLERLTDAVFSETKLPRLAKASYAPNGQPHSGKTIVLVFADEDGWLASKLMGMWDKVLAGG